MHAGEGSEATGEPEIEPLVLAREPEFHRLLSRIPQGVVLVNSELGLEYANPAGYRFLGPGARQGAPLPDPWPTPSLRQLARSLFTAEPAVGAELVAAGELTISVEGVASAHSPTAILILEDVTERERVRRAERQFVENAAHELRTPLAAILSAVDVLDGGAAEDPEARRHFLGHIRSQSERLRRLATSLLVLARAQAGVEHVRLDLVPVRPLLEEVADELRASPRVKLEVRAPDDLAVLADRDLLHHALENAASNAAKFTRQGQITLAACDAGRMVEIQVVDTGVGMTAGERSQAFDRFYRADDGAGGFGLGLAIAREAVRALGGDIEVDRPGDAGTTVRLRIPGARLTY